MRCKVEGCDRDARYKADRLCQKHYFRKRRYGTTELKRVVDAIAKGYSRKYRITMPGKGYQRLYEPDHPLADKSGTVSEHRMVVFDRYGRNLPPCEICGKPMSWDDDIHIDHRDDDVTNNHINNLRPLCRPCNTFRNYPEQHTIAGRHAITIDGVTKTPAEWARDPLVRVCGAQIMVRKRAGMSDYDAVFAPKKTHNRNEK